MTQKQCALWQTLEHQDALLQPWSLLPVALLLLLRPAAAAAVHHFAAAWLPPTPTCAGSPTRGWLPCARPLTPSTCQAAQRSTKHTCSASVPEPKPLVAWPASGTSARNAMPVDTEVLNCVKLRCCCGCDSLLWLLLALQHPLRLACAAVHWSTHSVSANGDGCLEDWHSCSTAAPPPPANPRCWGGVANSVPRC
jgi:hypothetical protein